MSVYKHSVHPIGGSVHDTVDEAMATYLTEVPVEFFTRTVKVHALVRKKVPDDERGKLVDCVIETLLELLDEKYLDPDESNTPVTPTMRLATGAFVDAVLKEYVIQDYVSVPEEDQTVDVVQWFDTHVGPWYEDAEVVRRIGRLRDEG